MTLRPHRPAAILLSAALLCALSPASSSAALEPTLTRPIAGDIKSPVRLSGDDPTYTEIAREARIQGTVILETVIDRAGKISRVRVVKGLPMGLTDSAIEAAKTWNYQPATLNGERVKVYYQVTVNFRLEK